MHKNAKSNHTAILIMKVALLPILLVTAFFTCSFAKSVRGQDILNKKITLELPSRELKAVLKVISQQTEVNFTYSNSTLPDRKKVTVSARDEKLGDVLTRILQPLDISYEVIHEQIVLHKDKPEMSVAANETAGVLFKTVSGTVTEASGAPIPGVSVVILGTSKGTTTNGKGYFEIQANEGETLVFSSIGYAATKVVVGASSTLSVVLSSSVKSLDSVAITAFGIRRSVRALGFSQEQVKGAEIARSNAPNVINALAGKMAGVNVTSPNGVDGGTTRIVIGGNNTIQGDNQPLIIVDGMPMANDMPSPYDAHDQSTGSVLYTGADAKSGSNPKDWGSPINLINPDDIESMSVLKGPTAAALYGGKGANGVILITTKKGTSRPGLGVDYTFGYKLIDPYRYLKMQNQYGSGGMVSLDPPEYLTDGDGKPVQNDSWTGLFADGKTGSGPYGQNTYDQVGWPGTGLSWGHKMDGTVIKWWDGTQRADNPQPDNLKLLYRNGMQTKHNVSVSGGNEWGTVRASYTRLDNSAVLPNSDYNQNTFNLGANVKLSKRLNVQINTSYFINEYHNAPQLGNDDGSSWQKRLLYNVPRDYKGEDISIYKNKDGSQNPMSAFPFVGNGGAVVWNMLENNATQTRHKLLGAIQLNYTATDFLDIMFRGGLDNNDNGLVTKNKPTDALGLAHGYYGRGIESDNSSNFDFLATFHKENLANKTINVKLSAGGTAYKRDAYGMLDYNDNWAIPFTYSLNGGSFLGTQHPTAESILQKRMNSVYAFANIAYKDYLFLDVTGRNDWSSALPKGQWSYFFPSFAGSFVFSDAFHIDPSVLSFGKIRAAYAEAAVDPTPYQVNYTYNITTFGGQTASMLPTTLQAPNYKPAMNKTADFGLVLGFFGNKLNLDMRYYHGRSSNQILSSPLPNSSGVSSIVVNSGVMENSGLELILNAKPIDTRDFKWNISLNISHNNNKLLSLSEGADKVDLASTWNDGGQHGPKISAKVGDQFGTIYGYDHVYDPKTKLPLLISSPFGDPNMNGTLYQSTATQVPIGNATPKIIGGITNTFTFRGGISVSMLIDSKIGGQIWSGTYATMMQQGQAPETLKERNGGGLAYTTPNGTKTNYGVILPGVFADGTVNTNVVHYYYKYMQYGVWSSTQVKDGDGNTVNGTDWNEKTSVLTDTWVKMREININYALPERIVKRTKIFQAASISLVGRDLFYLYSSLPDHINPEGSNGAGNAQGLEFASLPSFRSLGFQVRVSF